MNFLHILILSAVEGLTEFLPVSSTGHLILTTELLKIEPLYFQKTFEIVIQFGAILAIILLYFKSLVTNWALVKKILTAFVPTAAVGFTLYPLIKDVLLGSSSITLNALFWGGIALIGAEYFLKRRNFQTRTLEKVTYRQALIIGTFQSLSVVPGVSRAAATIIGGLLTGLNRQTATEFSFLLAVPTMFAAAGFDLIKSREEIMRGGYIALFAGSVLSFFFAIIAVKFLINYVKKHDFRIFGVYRIALSAVFWLVK